MLAGVAAAAVVVIATAASLITRGDGGMFNDFYDYWGAGRVLLAGGNPYDIAAVGNALAAAHVSSQVGTGYSYPALFAYLVVPLAALPPRPAAWVFTGLSVAGLVIAIGILASPLSRLRLLELVLLGAASGWFTASRGTIYFGQANLLVLPLLALAYRGVARPASLALASAVKLYPVAGLLPLAFRRADRRVFAVTAGLTAGLVVLPNLLLPRANGGGQSGGARIASFVERDPYWTNQSINGWLSRLAYPGDYTRPPLPGLDATVAMLAVVAFLGLAVLVVLWSSRALPWDGCLALVLCFGVVAAPKNSLWNYTPLLLAVFFCWPRVRRRWPALAVLGAGFGLVQLQSIIDTSRETFYGFQPALTWLSSLALYGALVVCGLTAFLVLTQAGTPSDSPSTGDRRASR